MGWILMILVVYELSFVNLLWFGDGCPSPDGQLDCLLTPERGGTHV
jgi:hypothetical protein